MKKTALLAFKCTEEMRAAIERLAIEGDRTLSMQLVKIVREWLEEHAPSPKPAAPAAKPKKPRP
jgi:hypothetical protein